MPESPRVIVLGATSAIAEAVMRLYAAEAARIALVGRQRSRLEAIAADLATRGASRVSVHAFDPALESSPDVRLREASDALDGVDHVLLFYGMLGEQTDIDRSWPLVRDMVRVNFTSAAEWMLAASELMQRQNRGSLVVISSVAGDRGRKTNYVYGACKAALTTIASGLAHRFASSPVRVVAIKLGFVDTPMTAAFEKGGLLWAKPEQIAPAIRRAADQGGPILYVPWFWRPIMLVIRMMPWLVFRRLNI